MTCPSAHLDGAYVLGALAPAERQDYERHLAGCAECASAVRALAGLPGLLGRVDAAVVTGHVDAAAPPTLLPALVAEVRRRERRRLLTTAALGAAAAVAVVAGALVGWGLLSGADEAPPATAPSAVAMSPVGGAPVDARVVLEDVAWGTRLSLTCTYTAPPDAEGGSAVYVLVVRTKDGGTERVGTWEALPGRSLQVVGATASRRGDIAAVEVRTESGLRLLELRI